MDHDRLSVYDSDFFIAWEKFAGDISRAFYEAAGDEIIRPLATQQARYTVAVIRVAELLTAVGEKEIANKFYVLAEAMNDLVEGDLPPLKWSSLRYDFRMEDRLDGKEEAYG